MSESAPTEGKVWSASFGGTAGATLGTFLAWLLGVIVWGAPGDAESADLAVASVPAPVLGVLVLGLTFGGAYVSGWLAKHTPRPLPEVDPPSSWPEQPESMVVSNTPLADKNGDGHDDKTGHFLPKE